jgi:hypothetical protein
LSPARWWHHQIPAQKRESSSVAGFHRSD